MQAESLLGSQRHAIFYQVFEDAPVIFAVLDGRSDFQPILRGRES
jgi:hypothetical protein